MSVAHLDHLAAFVRRTVTVTSLFLLLGSAGVQFAHAAGEAAPAGPRTWHEVRADARKFDKSILLSAYETHSLAKPDPDVKAYLEAMAAWYADVLPRDLYSPPDVPTSEDASRRGHALIDKGIRHPLVLLSVGLTSYDLDEASPKTLALLGESMAAMRKAGGYPPHLISSAAWRLVRSLPPEEAKDAQAALDEALPLIAISALDDPSRRVALDHLWRVLDRQKFEERERLLQAWGAQPNADPWVLDVLRGKHHIRRAWDIRGSDLAFKVTEQGWAGFGENLKFAAEELTRAWRLAPEMPQAAHEMISVAMGGGPGVAGGTPTDWFERATAAQVDFYDSYNALCWALRPRWGGSREAMYNLGLHALKSRRFDTCIPLQFMEVVWQLADDREDHWAVLDDPDLYAKFAAMLDGYIVAQAKKPLESWYRTLRAALAWRAGKYDEARRALDQLTEPPEPEAFGRFNADRPAEALAEVYVLTGPQADAVRAAAKAEQQGQEEDALKAFETVKSKLPTDDPGGVYVNGHVRRLSRKFRLERGEWVEAVDPDEEHKGWDTISGKWHYLPDGTLVGRRSESWSGLAILNEDLGPRYEFSVDISAATPDLKWSPGLAFRGSQGAADMCIGPAEVRFRNNYAHTDDAVKVHLSADYKTVLMRFDNGKIDVSIDGKQIVTGYDTKATPENFHPGLMSGNPAGAKFNNVRVRKLVGEGK